MGKKHVKKAFIKIKPDITTALIGQKPCLI